MRPIFGHFKPISGLRLHSTESDNGYNLLLSSSEDFSVRVWCVCSTANADSIQILQYLDINQWNSEVICIDWTDESETNNIPSKILSLDVNQNLRVWDLGASPDVAESVAKQLEKLENQLDQRRNLDEESLSELHQSGEMLSAHTDIVQLCPFPSAHIYHAVHYCDHA